MNDPSQVLNHAYGIWQPPPPPPAEDPMGFSNPARPPPQLFAAPGGVKPPGRMNWKAKKAADKRKVVGGGLLPLGGAGVGVSGYKPPTLHELQFQNRVKARRFYPKKKFSRPAPFAPRNTTSFIIRAKKSGGIASLVSPCPVTPAVLPTPKLSPTREDLADMVKEEWGVDGYGSMKGRIRLRSPSGSYEIRPGAAGGEEEVEDEEGSSESDVEEHLEVERRLDHDVSRFEMVYPGEEHGPESAADLLESRVDDQDAHIARLEEENLTLKERLFLMEREMGDLRRRVQLLEESRSHDRDDDNNNNNNEGNKKSNSDSGNAPENMKEVEGEEECSAERNGNPDAEMKKSNSDSGNAPENMKEVEGEEECSAERNGNPDAEMKKSNSDSGNEKEKEEAEMKKSNSDSGNEKEKEEEGEEEEEEEEECSAERNGNPDAEMET